jgi:hypothetical protein
MKLDFQCVTAHLNPGFMTSWRGPCSWIVMRLSPVWPESGFLTRGLRGGTRLRPDARLAGRDQAEA